MSSKRLEELQKKLQNTEDGSESLTDEEMEELKGGEEISCNNDPSCHDSNSGCNPGCNPSCTPGGNP